MKTDGKIFLLLVWAIKKQAVLIIIIRLSIDVIEISKSLPFCKSLMRLDIRNNPWIATEGYSCLADEMKRNHTLAFLEIDVSVNKCNLAHLLHFLHAKT